MKPETRDERDRRVAADVAAIVERVRDDGGAWDRVERLVDVLDSFVEGARRRLDPKLAAALDELLREPLRDARDAVIFKRSSSSAAAAVVSMPAGSIGNRVVSRYWSSPDYKPASAGGEES